ncbi:endonuclease/exonuclease/phosphatase family protein [Flavilitoribacter nigricans]|uniref:endonuclease/exonuclease/phosphatase family protein n=1 Tax=Flavilitoribacter nigricans TaxID=70997 RepID=UPI00117A4E4F|nr:endonuclease/exonuclease/phosphatase family protein [Flavilitoribacter nigricans]
MTGLLIYGSLNDYQPEKRLALIPFQNNDCPTVPISDLSFSIWNLGFGGLGRESDFFYDDGRFFFSGGKNTRTPRSLVDKNVEGILKVIDSLDSDFYLLQEVDLSSRRSHYINQTQAVGSVLEDYSGVYAENFLVPYVPIPVFEPWHAYGKAHSGLASFSRNQPHENTRIQLPGNFSWPTRVFSLDRCLNWQRYPTENGRELIVVNVHNSAYDADGALKEQQLELLRQLLLEEYEKGNYVIAGGDWNMCPPYFRFDGYMPGRAQGYTQINIPELFFPGDWLWIYDATYPTNRKTKTPYKPGDTFVTLIDFFLVSPNVSVKEVNTIHLDFEYSDHQPVKMVVDLQ